MSTVSKLMSNVSGPKSRSLMIRVCACVRSGDLGPHPAEELFLESTFCVQHQ